MDASRTLRILLPVTALAAAVLGVVVVTGSPDAEVDTAADTAADSAVDSAASRPSGDTDAPRTIALPRGLQPEGITSDGDTTFYVGSLADGRVVRGDLGSGDTEVLVPGRSGRVAVGMQLEDRNRLWVAGGPTGAVTVYDAGTGRQLRRWQVAGSGFLNDVTVTEDAAYVTDSQVQRLVVIPFGDDGALPPPGGAGTLALTGDISFVPDEFNANGIRALGDDVLLLVQSNTGALFRVDPATGSTDAVELTAGELAGGDGLELGAGRLFVVRGGGGNDVAVVRLRQGGRSAQIERLVTDPRFDVPTTATYADGGLWAVNARFDTEPAPTTEYAVVRVGLD